MPEHMTRDERALYDHESPEAPGRRPADDWGIDESFPRVRGRRFARSHEGPPRRRRRPVEDWGVDKAFEPAAQPEPVTHTEEIVAVDAPEPEVVTEARRTIRINGRPGELSEIAPFTSAARRRRPPLTVEERLAGDPTRIIAWAVGLGMLLILIAILTS
jgi:hypothetical protein